MRAKLKNGKVVTGRLAEIFVKCRVAIPINEVRKEDPVVLIKKAVFEQRSTPKQIDKPKGKPKGRPVKVKK